MILSNSQEIYHVCNPIVSKNVNQLILQLFVNILLAIFFIGFICAQTLNSTGSVIPNFGKINDHYYRGAQFDEKQLLALKRLGIKTIIDLQKDGLTEEKGWVHSAGLQYYLIPLSSHHPA